MHFTNSGGVKLVLIGPKFLSLVKWCGHTSFFQLRVKCQPSYITYLILWWPFKCQFRPCCHPFFINTISCRKEIKYSIRMVALCTLNGLLHMIL